MDVFGRGASHRREPAESCGDGHVRVRKRQDELPKPVFVRGNIGVRKNVDLGGFRLLQRREKVEIFLRAFRAEARDGDRGDGVVAGEVLDNADSRVFFAFQGENYFIIKVIEAEKGLKIAFKVLGDTLAGKNDGASRSVRFVIAPPENAVVPEPLVEDRESGDEKIRAYDSQSVDPEYFRPEIRSEKVEQNAKTSWGN